MSGVCGVTTVVRVVVKTAGERVYERRCSRRSLLLRLSASRCGGGSTSIQSRVAAAAVVVVQVVVQVANVQDMVNGFQQSSDLVLLREERDVVAIVGVVGVRGRPDHGNFHWIPPRITIVVAIVVVETSCHGEDVTLRQGKSAKSVRGFLCVHYLYARRRKRRKKERGEL